MIVFNFIGLEVVTSEVGFYISDATSTVTFFPTRRVGKYSICTG